ncbi:MAG: bifunctional [glutamate--ammonia ligase]-adenylyl-L-tyrosine phosphorylase/[glutamate--ammonia-ligase] adenylyltransferase [Wenzhouxiangellaceae bacterium]
MSASAAQGFVAASQFASEVLGRWRLDSGWLDAPGPVDLPGLEVGARLRRLRQLESLLILWDEYRGRHDVEETGRRLSALADRCIGIALDEAEQRVAAQAGRLPGVERPIAVIALGKLGGQELNFHSDVDLVYCHAAGGTSDGPRRLSFDQYLQRLVREFATLMEAVTPQGRVWPVDTRLRPFGQSGALVWSVDAMERYFINEGRAWERYAWLKARPVAGDVALAEDLLARIRPFVFRRYLDYGLFENLRTLHAEIDQRARRDDLQADIKRGPGGIRELEFIVQSLQLLHGGREPALRVTGFLPALDAASNLGLLDRDEAVTLREAYRWLRRLENRLQLCTGRQTHELPHDRATRERLAWLMGEDDWKQLAAHTQSVRDQVQQAFSRHIGPSPTAGPVSTLWPPDEALPQRLAERGFADPAGAADRLHSLARRLARRPLSAVARQRLERVMPLVLDALSRQPSPDSGFDDLLRLIETVARRSAYLALLEERPQVLERAIELFRRSGRIASWVISSPQLLDDLIAPGDMEPGAAPALFRDDLEASLDALVRYRQASRLRIALAELDGRIDAITARQLLTSLAERIVGAVAALYLNQPDLIIVGYGNLGAGMMHYESDLDLVFLHAGGPPPLRAVQRMIHALQMPLPGGRLYPVDTRLRPNGNAGLLLSTLDSFADYQHQRAWTWEHQALIRARSVHGEPEQSAAFESIRSSVLAMPRERGSTLSDLAQMRARQRAGRQEDELKRLLVDLQFVAEAGVLCEAHRHPALIALREPGSQLAELGRSGFIERDLAGRLRAIWHRAVAAQHQRYLLREPGDVVLDADRACVDAAFRELFGEAAARG